MQKVVVTGGAGFIGSHLTELALGLGHEVTIIDNLVTGTRANIQEILKALEPAPRSLWHMLDLRVADCLNPHVWDAIGDADVVYHIASPAAPQDYLAHPIETLKVGSEGTMLALEFAKRTGARFIYTSTSEVYGDPQISPQPETYWGNVNPIGIRSVYDEAKRYAEALIMSYYRTYKMPVTIVRLFNTYGPRMRELDGRAVPNFILQALRNQPITVYGEGRQIRSFCYVDDTVAALYDMMQINEPGPFNIGNPNSISIRELAQRIIELTYSDSEMVFEPLPQDDPKVRCPDISRIKEAIGWEPKIDLDNGLKKTIEWMRVKYGL